MRISLNTDFDSSVDYQKNKICNNAINTLDAQSFEYKKSFMNVYNNYSAYPVTAGCGIALLSCLSVLTLPDARVQKFFKIKNPKITPYVIPLLVFGINTAIFSVFANWCAEKEKMASKAAFNSAISEDTMSINSFAPLTLEQEDEVEEKLQSTYPLFIKEDAGTLFNNHYRMCGKIKNFPYIVNRNWS